MKELAGFEVYRLLSRRWALLLPVLLLVPAVLVAMAPWILVPGIDGRATLAFHLSSPLSSVADRPAELENRYLYWVGVFENLYSSSYLLYSVTLCVLGLVLGVAAVGGDGRDPDSSPLHCLPLSAGARILGELAGKAGVLLVYHTIAWGVWAWLSLNLVISTGEIVASFFWPPLLATIYVCVGVMLRHVGRDLGLMGWLPLSAPAVTLIVKLIGDAVIARGLADFTWAGEIPLPTAPGLRELFNHDAGAPWYLNNLLLLLTTVVLCAAGFAFEMRRTRSRHVL